MGESIRTFSSVEGVHAPVGRYAHAAVANGFIFVSGCASLDENRTFIGAGDAAAQTRQILSNARTILASLGAGPGDIIKETVYLTDVEDRFATRPEREAFYGTHLPASTLIEVKGLSDPEMLVEMDFIAVLPAENVQQAE